VDSQLTRDDIGLILEYTKKNISEGDAPWKVKQRKLEDVESGMAKLRTLRDGLAKR
jgi:hypothetical protein